jgi:hypothetical protein
MVSFVQAVSTSVDSVLGGSHSCVFDGCDTTVPPLSDPANARCGSVGMLLLRIGECGETETQSLRLLWGPLLSSQGKLHLCFYLDNPPAVAQAGRCCVRNGRV